MSNSAHMPARPRAVRVLPLALLALLATPTAAHAHSLFGNHDPNRPLIDYLTLGFGHMVGGWDHLLFIGGVVLLSGSLRTAAKLISLFVAGHSLTLLIATIAEWKLDATAVDVVIALSLVYVGVQGIRGRPQSLRVFGSIVFAFGLAHGLGLSTRLQDLGLPDDGIVERVILFNIGVELGQLTALTVIVGAGTLIARGLHQRAEAARYAFGALALSGLVAAAVISFPDEASRSNQQRAADASGCVQQDTQPPPYGVGGHPEKRFYEPDDQPDETDLDHVIGDGYVIVRYRPNLAPNDVETLRALLRDPQNQAIIAAPDPEQTEPIKAITALRILTCTKLDAQRLTSFRDDWRAYLQALQRQP